MEWIEPERSATAELVYDILDVLPVDLTPSMSEGLYTGLVADTQCFRGSTTTAETHSMARR